jgi:hypothetical protein
VSYWAAVSRLVGTSNVIIQMSPSCDSTPCSFVMRILYVCITPIPVAVRSKAYVCGRLVAGVAVSIPARGLDVCLLCLYVVLSCVGRGLCDELITRPEESYRVSVCV